MATKTARILDEDDSGFFRLEYDNDRGSTNQMRLEATTYDRAIREAKVFLGINGADCDGDGNQWKME